MDDIGKIVGLNKVSLYYYFTSKEIIFKSALAREAAQFDERSLAEAKAASGFRERIKTWISRSSRYSQESGLLRSVSAENLSAMRPFLREYRIRSLESGSTALASFIEEGIAAGEARACDSKRVARTIFYVMVSMKRLAYQESDGEVDIDAMLERILFAVDLILDGIATSRAAGA